MRYGCHIWRMVTCPAMKKTTMYFPEDLDAAVQAAARREGRPAAAIVRDAVTEYLARRPAPISSFIGCMESRPDDGVDSSNVRRWVRDTWEDHLVSKGRVPPRTDRADDR